MAAHLFKIGDVTEPDDSSHDRLRQRSSRATSTVQFFIQLLFFTFSIRTVDTAHINPHGVY